MAVENAINRYTAARKTGALFSRESLAVLTVSGPDALDFIDRLGTACVKGIALPEGVQTLFLNGDGRLITDAVCMVGPSGTCRLITDRARRDVLAEHLDRMHFVEKLTISKDENQLVFQLRAPGNSPLFSAVGSFGNKGCLFFQSMIAPLSHPDGFLLLPHDLAGSLMDKLWSQVTKPGGIAGDKDLYELMRIEDGIPSWKGELSDKSIPLETGLKQAVNFTKGCYPGQEIIARIDTLGHPARCLVGLKISGAPDLSPNTKLAADGEEVGMITSCAFSFPADASLALAIVKWKFREGGTVLAIEREGTSPVRAIVYDLPMAGRV